MYNHYVLGNEQALRGGRYVAGVTWQGLRGGQYVAGGTRRAVRGGQYAAGA